MAKKITSHTYLYLIFAVIFSLVQLVSLLTNEANAETVPQTIKAKEFVLVGDDGQPRAGLGMENSNPFLYLTDNKGTVRAYITVSGDGPTLVFRDKANKPRLIIELNSTDLPSVGFLSDTGATQAIFSIVNGNLPNLMLFDNNGNGRLSLGIHHDTAGLAILDSSKRPQISLQARDGKGALISLHDRSNDQSLAMGLRDGKSFMYAFDKDGSGVFSGAQRGKGPALVLKERGKITWAAGSNGAATDARDLEQGFDLDGLAKDLLR